MQFGNTVEGNHWLKTGVYLVFGILEATRMTKSSSRSGKRQTANLATSSKIQFNYIIKPCIHLEIYMLLL